MLRNERFPQRDILDVPMKTRFRAADAARARDAITKRLVNIEAMFIVICTLFDERKNGV